MPSTPARWKTCRLDRTADFEDGLLRHVSGSHPDILESIAETRDLTEDIESRLTQVITDYKSTFGI